MIDISQLLRPIRGCATDEQYRDVWDNVEAEIDRLHTLLEDNFVWRQVDGVMIKVAVEPGSIPNGIECRNETIRLQDAEIKRLRERIELLRGE